MLGETPMTLKAGVTGNDGPAGVFAPQASIIPNKAAPLAVIPAWTIRKPTPLVFGVFDMLFPLLSLGARNSDGSVN